MPDFEQDLIKCLSVLKEGGIIIYPTDTIWGLGCDATNSKAVRRIFAVKSRENSKAMIVLVADEKDIRKYVAAPNPEVFDYLKSCTKPTTVIYEGAIGLAPELVAEDGSVAIRLVKDDFCRHLIKRFRKPIVSTSANVSNELSPKNFASISAAIKEQADYIVRFRQDELKEFRVSSIIRWNRYGPPTVIRE